MKFAVARTGVPAAAGEHLLQAVLQHFRRIHAAKRSFRGAGAFAFSIYVRYFSELTAISVTRSNCGMLH
jgi:hypothetical protein